MRVLQGQRWRCLIATSGVMLLSSCGSGNGAGPRVSVFNSEYILSAPQGLEQSVVIDSVRWKPSAFDILPQNEFEIVGPYEIHFRSVVDVELEMRYDLRFLAGDGFLIREFRPFGLPVILAPRQKLVESGMFEIRFTGFGLDELRTMHIAATVQAVTDG